MTTRIITAVLALCAIQLPAAEIAHGPILGRLGATEIGVWARTKRAGEFRVRYGTSRGDLSQLSDSVRTTIDHDNANWVHITGLEPNTSITTKSWETPAAAGEKSSAGISARCPTPTPSAIPRKNPKGLFNYSFEYACGNNQPSDPSLPGFRTMLREIEDKINFAILDGDWIYEEKRDYTPEAWSTQVAAARVPRIVDLAPTIVGVWENYKLYLTRGLNLADWHREVPSFFMFDDHEMLNDVNGTGTPGLRNRRAAFRDIGIRAWYDYLGWSNPIPWAQDIHFGKARLTGGSDILEDPSADFRELKRDQIGTLTVHWGTPDAGVNNLALDSVGGDPNAGVYEITEVLDRNRLRISPAAKEDGQASYSVGRFSHFRQKISNTEFFYIDTRSHRMMHDLRNPFEEGISVLGAPQKAWLKKGCGRATRTFSSSSLRSI